MKSIAAILALLCASCAAPHGYLGVQHVTPMNAFHKGRATDSGSAYFNLLFPLGERWSVQIEPIVPFNGSEPILRLAVDCKLF